MPTGIGMGPNGVVVSATFVLRCCSAPFLRFVIAARARILGRSSRCDLVVDHPSISRRHAQCRVGEAGLLVTDLGSRNGTYVDNQRVEESRVRRGQTLRFGTVSFVVAIEGVQDTDAEEAEPETETGADDPAAPAAPQAPGVELLSDAQRRVFDLLVTGNKEKGIARRLGLSPHTVHNHVRAIFRAFAVHSRAELLARLLARPGG